MISLATGFAPVCSASSCTCGADKRPQRGVCSAASHSIDAAQPTHRCADEESPLLIIQHCPLNLDGHSLKVMEGERKRPGEGSGHLSVCDHYKLALDFLCAALSTSSGKTAFFFSGWEHKLMNKQKDAACDCENTWLQLV